jgi:hypothetical protein
MKKILLLIIVLYTTFSFSQIQIGSDLDGVAAADYFGSSVSLSNDGNVIAIGAKYNDTNGSNSGHVRIFSNNNGIWEQIGNSINGENLDDWSGYSISLSSNGSIVAVGAHNNDGNGQDSGHVRIFRNNNGVWEQIGTDINGEAAGDYSSHSISLSSDGSIVAVGAEGNDGNGQDSGHVRVFRNNNGVWEQIGLDIDGEAAADQFGISISLSSDGSIVAIGAERNDGNGISSGHVRVFRNNNGVWEQIGSDIDGEVAGDQFGSSISLSSDGNIVAIGARHNDGNGISSGHVRVFRNNNGVWEQIGSDIDGEAAGDQSGYSVSLSSNGNTITIGAPRNQEKGNKLGHVRIFKNNKGIWNQFGIDIDGEAAGDFSGSSVSLSSNGNIVAIGAIKNNGNGDLSGHVRVYDLSTVLKTNDFLVSKFSVFPNPVKKYFTIQLKEKIQFKKVNIYNSLGQFIKSSNKLTTNILSIKKGVYFLEIETNKGNATKKLVIE